MEKAWRVLGIDDSFDEKKCVLVGCVMSGEYVEGFMVERISIDGLDSTDAIIRMVRKSKFREQIKCIMLSGITFGGFNVADIVEINARTGIPVVVVMRKEPNMREFMEAMENVGEVEKRKKIVERAGRIRKIAELFVQFTGIGADKVYELLMATKIKGNIPEPLRVAHLVASAIIHGESRGRV